MEDSSECPADSVNLGSESCFERASSLDSLSISMSERLPIKIPGPIANPLLHFWFTCLSQSRAKCFSTSVMRSLALHITVSHRVVTAPKVEHLIEGCSTSLIHFTTIASSQYGHKLNQHHRLCKQLGVKLVAIRDRHQQSKHD